MSPVMENQSHEIRSSGSTILGQPIQATTVVDMALPIEPFLIENGRLSNVSYEVNTTQSSNSHSRYILHVSVQFIMTAYRDGTSEGEYDRDPIGIRFHEHYYIPLCNTNWGLTFNVRGNQGIYEYCIKWRVNMR